MNLSTKQKQTHRHREQIVVARGCGGGLDWKFRVSRCKLLYLEWRNNKVLLCNTGNYIQHPAINHKGKDYEIKLQYNIHITWTFLVAQMVKSAMWETWVRSLGWEDPLEKETATLSNILTWRTPWREEPGGLQPTGLQRVRQD